MREIKPKKNILQYLEANIYTGADIGHYFISGIISYGVGCANKKYPGVYTDASDSGLGLWIKSEIYAAYREEHFAARNSLKNR